MLATPNEFLPRLMRNENLARPEALRLLDWLLDGTATDAQIAATLIALKQKGETVEELAGLAEGMRARATRITCKHECFIDTAGTGSSAAKTFNVSTAAAFVIAAAGLPVAKHGNRAASSKCGSADVLVALGVNVSASPDVSEKCLEEIGICFMFAPLYHSATARVAGIRRELGVHTTFNLLGPLTNPAGAPRQIIGVWHEALVEPLAHTLLALGTERAWVVHGLDGLDEVTLADSTKVAEVSGGGVRVFERSEEHTSELQSRSDLVCRLLLEKKKTKTLRALHGVPKLTQPRGLSQVPRDHAEDLKQCTQAGCLYREDGPCRHTVAVDCDGRTP